MRAEHAADKSPLALANRRIGTLAAQLRKDAGRLIGTARGRVNQALKAKAALDARADERYNTSLTDANRLEELLSQLKGQIEPQARAVLEAAKEFKKLDGLARLTSALQ